MLLWFCMAGAGDAVFPSITCMTLFFSFLLLFHFTTAAPVSVKQLTLSPTSTKDGVNKKTTMEVNASTRQDLAQKETTNAVHVPQLGRGRSRPPSSPLPWQNKIFNASEHEVPSGPNPISNR
ncbi:hypothetical protein L6164_017031 [Bauhinia variegata]|uniref:Uncharacterized protein n=1 Tax=Bauhinia variegata TaxID=167791 RepID=A0ACB9N8G5_BAUVA|nr:hypothetical protein L6164_017031 [Bauhinia variegata]